MAEIEFLDTVGPSDPAGPTTAPAPVVPATAAMNGRPDTAARWAGSVLLVLAAGLSVYAAFRTLYTIELAGEQFNYRASIDGWGRNTVRVGGQESTSHGTRFGIGLAVAGGALTLAALLLPIRRGAAAGHRIAIGGVGLLLGVLGSIALQIRSAHDIVRAQFAAGTGTQAAPPVLHFTVGWSVWIGLIAVACAGAALVAPSGLRRLTRHSDVCGQSTPPSFDVGTATLHPADERLGEATPTAPTQTH